MFLRLMQWSNHCVPWQIDFVGVLFGLRPLFFCVWFVVVCFAVSSGETQVWLGDLRVVVVWWSCVFFGCSTLICLLVWTNCVLVQTSFRQLMLM